MRYAKVPVYRLRARHDLHSICDLLAELGAHFYTAFIMAKMGEATIKEMDRVSETMVESRNLGNQTKANEGQQQVVNSSTPPRIPPGQPRPYSLNILVLLTVFQIFNNRSYFINTVTLLITTFWMETTRPMMLGWLVSQTCLLPTFSACLIPALVWNESTTSFRTISTSQYQCLFHDLVSNLLSITGIETFFEFMDGHHGAGTQSSTFLCSKISVPNTQLDFWSKTWCIRNVKVEIRAKSWTFVKLRIGKMHFRGTEIQTGGLATP